MAKNIVGEIGGIQKFSTEDGPGIRTTVFLKGCPLNCLWCHNPELIRRDAEVLYTPSKCIACYECIQACKVGAISSAASGISIARGSCIGCMECVKTCFSLALRSASSRLTVQEVMEKVVQDVGYYRNTNGGLTISGGELLAQPCFSEVLLRAAKDVGLHVALDTSGYGKTELLMKLAEKADLILYDLKAIADKKHMYLTGKSNDLILHNLRVLASKSEIISKIIIRLPLVGGLNDTEEDMQLVIDRLLEMNLKQVNLIPYHDMGNSKRIAIGEKVKTFNSPDENRLATILAMFRKFDIAAETGR